MKKYVTKEGVKKLKEEIEKLENIERGNISIKITEARDKGDISENAEYDAAKEDQEFLEARIASLKKSLAKAKIIDVYKMDESKVSILSRIKIKKLNYGCKVIYTLVPEEESNLKIGIISVNSPIYSGLLGKKVGDIAHLMEDEYEILEIFC
ncbi:MAG TPA: transcription elongation factor GreA [Blattabacteriaceae bacterium]